MNEQELQLLGKALETLPYGQVAGLVQKLREQIAKQQNQQSQVPQVPPPTEPKAEPKGGKK